MKKTKSIFLKVLLLVFLLIPCLAKAGDFSRSPSNPPTPLVRGASANSTINVSEGLNLEVGDLVKLENSSSIYQIRSDNTRLVFSTESVYKSYYDNFDNIKTVSADVLKSYSLNGNILLKTGSLVKFDYNSKVYEVKAGGEIEWIKSEEGFKSAGYDFDNVVKLPEIFWGDYKLRKTDSSYDEVLSKIKTDFIDQDKVEDIENIASSSKGLVEILDDEYSVFWTAEEYQKFSEWLNNDSFQGIGAEIGIHGNQLTIVTPLKGSPAEAAGLEAGDKVKFIDGFDTTGIDINEAVMKIRGPEGEEVVLSVARDGEKDIIDISIIRGVIVVEQFSWEEKQTSLGRDIVYLNLSQFSLGAWESFTNSKDDILEIGPQGMILDVRNNPGGYLQMALDASSRWLESGDLIMIEERAGDVEVERVANEHNYYFNIPLVVLVNKGSASASEIVAGALRDHKVATIVGEKTFGKGVVQEVVSLSDGNVMKLTVSEWLTPNGDEIDGVGIMPDVVIENSDENKDLQLEAAMEKIDELITNY
jgi:carboxyl-terminal processing protease